LLPTQAISRVKPNPSPPPQSANTEYPKILPNLPVHPRQREKGGTNRRPTAHSKSIHKFY